MIHVTLWSALFFGLGLGGVYILSCLRNKNIN